MALVFLTALSWGSTPHWKFWQSWITSHSPREQQLLVGFEFFTIVTELKSKCRIAWLWYCRPALPALDASLDAVAHAMAYALACHGRCRGMLWQMPWHAIAMACPNVWHGMPWQMPWHVMADAMACHGPCHGICHGMRHANATRLLASWVHSKSLIRGTPPSFCDVLLGSESWCERIWFSVDGGVLLASDFTLPAARPPVASSPPAAGRPRIYI